MLPWRCRTFGFTTSTGREDDCLGQWMGYGRDARLVDAAALFGLRLREAHPPEAARDLDRAPGFAQHFEASYRPIVLRALENDQPVLAWQGWPAPRQVMWGVITGPCDGGIGLAGVTIWSDGQTIPLVSPPVQLYVVEEASPRQPSDDQLLRFVIDSAHRVLHNELDERWGIVTGSRAYDLWAERLTRDPLCPSCGDQAGNCHRRMARFVTYARETAIRCLEHCRGTAATELQPLIDTLAVQCRGPIDALATARDEGSADLLMRTPPGRQTLAAGVRAAQTFEQAVIASIDELYRHLAFAPDAG